MFKDKIIALGVTGGIAAYKACSMLFIAQQALSTHKLFQ